MHPYYYSCPLKYLDLVPIDTYGGNAEWRDGVRRTTLADNRSGRRADSGYPPAVCQNNILHHQEHTMHDETETIRREEVAAINADPGSREALEAKHGQVWDTQELQQDFEVTGSWLRSSSFVASRTVLLARLKFQHRPRYYFDFKAD